MNDFKTILARLLEEKDLTQADLCRKTGIPTSLMSNYIKGSKSPALSNAILIAEALGVSLDILSGKFEYPYKNPPAPANYTGVGELRPDEKELLQDYNLLNEDGQIAARSAVRGLTFAPDYKKPTESKFLEENA